MLFAFLQALCIAAPAFTMDQAVDLALARNRALVAARLHVDEAQVEQMAAGILPNPELEYSVGNLVLGAGNDQEHDLHPQFFEQNIQAVGVSQTLDVWLKRRQRVAAAAAGVQQAQLDVQDAVREVQFTVRSAFADVVREQNERALAHETRLRYDQTVELSRRRREAGDISDAELRKIELEGLKYTNAEYDADLQWHMARHQLAALLALADAADLPDVLASPTLQATAPHNGVATAHALASRPDLQALRAAEQREALQQHAEERDAWPDITVGISYARSLFQISGDNPHVLGGNLSVPIPIFDRNQGGVERAVIARRAAANARATLELQVRREVLDATRKLERARFMLRTYEEGAMLQRAESALAVAEKSYNAGAISILDMLEAQRAYLETRAHYLIICDDLNQAAIEVAYATGGSL